MYHELNNERNFEGLIFSDKRHVSEVFNSLLGFDAIRKMSATFNMFHRMCLSVQPTVRIYHSFQEDELSVIIISNKKVVWMRLFNSDGTDFYSADRDCFPVEELIDFDFPNADSENQFGDHKLRIIFDNGSKDILLGAMVTRDFLVETTDLFGDKLNTFKEKFGITK